MAWAYVDENIFSINIISVCFRSKYSLGSWIATDHLDHFRPMSKLAIFQDGKILGDHLEHYTIMLKTAIFPLPDHFTIYTRGSGKFDH